MPVRIKALHAGMILAGGLLLLSSGALGLVLGSVSLSSTLNQPPNASIELSALEGLTAADIRVALGAQEDYDRVNVDRVPYLESISFDVEVDGDTGRILLTSPDNVVEPFLNLIISVTEPGGVTMEEYTLLVELPADRAVPPPEPQTEPQPAVQTAAPPEAGTAETWTVASGDTLWEIATSTRPSGTSAEQMMVAIRRANPDAFIDNNINRLINGRVLRIPDRQEIGAIDQQSAVAQVNQQNRELGAQPLAVNNSTGAASTADTRDQLSVLTSDGNAAFAGGSSDLAATIAALENELMLSEESVDRARIENLELNNRLSSLQEQIDLLENIIAIEDERIAKLQSELAAQAEATAQALASAQTDASAFTELNNEPASGLTGLLRNTVVLLGAGLVLVLVILGFLVYRRKQALVVADERTFNPALAGDTDATEAAKPGLLAGLLARFRRSSDTDDEDDEGDDYVEAAVTTQAAAPAPAQPAPQRRKIETDKLLNEMGLGDDLLNLDDALDGIDNIEPAAAADEDMELDISDLSFDDTMMTEEGEGGEERSGYKLRTGNECDTKLDLATAYEAMGDVAEAIEILDEVIAEGSPAQVEAAQRLKQTWQSS